MIKTESGAYINPYYVSSLDVIEMEGEYIVEAFMTNGRRAILWSYESEHDAKMSLDVIQGNVDAAFRRGGCSKEGLFPG